VTGVAPIRVGLTVLLAVAGLLLLGAALSDGAPATWWPLVDSPVPDTPWIPSR
jgi:hypothetical protein